MDFEESAGDAREAGGQDEAGRPAAATWTDLSGLPPELAAAAQAFMAGVEAFAAVSPRDLDGGQAAALAGLLARAVSRVAAVKATLLPVIEAEGLWGTGGSRSLPVWVARQHRVSVREAREQVRLGRALRDDLPLTAAATVAGDVTVEHARVLATYAPTTDLRKEALADRAQELNEAFLVHHAQRIAVDEYRTLARHWAAVIDPDADERGYVEASDREFLEIGRDFSGYQVKGQLTLEHGQLLLNALRAVTPEPAAGDDRTPTQRRAHALGDMARLTLDRGTGDGKGRIARPRLNTLVPYATLVALAAAADTKDDRDGRVVTLDEVADPAQLARLADGDQVVLGPHFEDGTPIPRKLLDKLACDGQIARYIFGPQSQILDVGRAERTFTGPRRAALVARDKHCQFPDCSAPPPLCEGHHVKHWSRDHGDTAVSNGILLCGYHHGFVHRHGIEIRRVGNRWVFTDARGTVIRPASDAATA